MADTCGNTRCGPEPQALSIHTRKITDSCRDKDCIEGLRVYLTEGSQGILDRAASAKVRSAQLLYTCIDVAPVAFDRNHYCVDVTFYYRILADAVIGTCHPAALLGLAVFTKRAVLCGEESTASVFTSADQTCEADGPNVPDPSLPVAVVEVLEPMVLCSKVMDVCECDGKSASLGQLPNCICSRFDEKLVLCGEKRRLYVTLGQFSVIRLERDVQLVVPVLGYSMPTKVCCENPDCAENPCEMFSRIPFPEERFNPTGCDKKGDCYKTTCGC